MLLTLLTVSLLLVLVLAFVALIRLELRQVTNQQNILAARANARLGAELAIARLQEWAGVDTRVTAPALYAPARPNQGLTTRAVDAGAYSTAAGGGLERNVRFNQTLGHLISAADPATFDPNAYWPFDASGKALSGSARLVGPGSVSDQQDRNGDGVPDGYVAAPLIALGSGGPGSFAWWVGDEGLKAQVNVTDPYFEASGARNSRAQALTAQRAGGEAVLAGYNPDNPTHNGILRRALNLEQINLLAGNELGPNAAKTFFHDLTPLSLGLPGNTRRGGLKRDLTAVFKEAEANGGNVDPAGAQWTQLMDDQDDRIARWRAETVALEAAGLLGVAPGADRHQNALQAMTLRADQADSRLNELIFPPLTDLHPQFDPGGARWEQLVTWATLKQRRGASGVTAQARWQNTAELSPVIARVSVAAFGSVDYPRASMHWVPTVVLWNPYNVPLRMDPGAGWRLVLKAGGNFNYFFRLRVSHPNWRIPNVTFKNAADINRFAHVPSGSTGGSLLWTPCFQFTWNSSAEGEFVFLLRGGDGGNSVVIPPGQARIFTMHGHVDVSPTTHGGAIDPTVTLREGLPPAPGQFSVYTTIHLEDQMDNHPLANPYPRSVRHPHTAATNFHREPIQAYNPWHPLGIGGGNFNARPQSLPYLFPLSYPDPLNPSPSTDLTGNTGNLLYAPANAPARSLCVNVNYLRGWEIEDLGFETGRTTNQASFEFQDVRLVLAQGGTVLAEVMHPTMAAPAILNLARLSDTDNPTFDEISPVLPPLPTPAADEPIPPGTVPGWGLSFGLRLPESAYKIDSTSGADSGDLGAGSSAAIRWLADFNPAAPFQLRDPASRMMNQNNMTNPNSWNGSKSGFKSASGYIGGFFMGTPRYADLTWATPDDINQFIGSTDDSPPSHVVGSVPKAILYELPDSPEDIASVASLMHAPLNPTSHALMPAPNQLPGNPLGTGVSNRDELPRALANSLVNYGYAQPAYMIGNARAHLLVARGRAEQSFYESVWATNPSLHGESVPYLRTRNPAQIHFSNPGAFTLVDPPASFFPGYDSSWIYNEVFWDDFFFTPQANSRLLWRDGIRPDDLPGDGVERDFTTSAGRVMVNGAFNVNSVSIPAWASLLHGMMGVDLGTGDTAAGSSAFSRFLQPGAGAFDPAADTYDSPEAYLGYRRLSEDEIWDDAGTPGTFADDSGLAVHIVRQIRARGPFLSLSDFVNRALVDTASDSPGHGLAGALQAAIDASGLNTAMGSPPVPVSWVDPATEMNAEWITPGRNWGDGFRGLHKENLDTAGPGGTARGGMRNAGAPGELTQADVLARIGAVLQARSDTFTVRAHGILGNANDPLARAWCEVTVQRLPEYVEEAADDSAVLPGNLGSTANIRFGRRFEIIAFRWLSEEDI